MVLNILLVTQKDDIVRPWCIKYFENSRKNMSFIIKDDSVLVKYNKIWIKIKETLNTKFYSMPVYDEKYMKVKVRRFNGVIKTNL